MKIAIKLVILIIVLQLNACQTYYGFSRKELNEHYEFVEYIINNVDSLTSIFGDTLKVNKRISQNNKLTKREINRIAKHIIENKFLDGYDFVDEDLEEYGDPITNYYYRHRIKIKSRFNGEIIWFVFFIMPPEYWKFSSFHFCNNYEVRGPHNPVPCDKE